MGLKRPGVVELTDPSGGVFYINPDMICRITPIASDACQIHTADGKSQVAAGTAFQIADKTLSYSFKD